MDPTPEQIASAAAYLRRGGVVAYPTETVYGLGADACSAEACARIFQVKHRPADTPLIVCVSGPAMARTVVSAWPEAARRLARAFWPGPLSLVLPRAAHIPDVVTAGGPTVAVRCPDHPVALALIFEFAGPVIGTSANVSGRLAATSAQDVRAMFDEDEVFVLGGGPCLVGIESTVVDLSKPDAPRILRPGMIDEAQIRRVLELPDAPGDPEPPAAPTRSTSAMSANAPRTPTRLVDAERIPSVLGEREVCAVVLGITCGSAPEPHVLVRMPGDAREYAAGLYAALRRAEDQGADVILIERPPASDPVWAAVTDRLERIAAASPVQ